MCVCCKWLGERAGARSRLMYYNLPGQCTITIRSARSALALRDSIDRVAALNYEVISMCLSRTLIWVGIFHTLAQLDGGRLAGFSNNLVGILPELTDWTTLTLCFRVAQRKLVGSESTSDRQRLLSYRIRAQSHVEDHTYQYAYHGYLSRSRCSCI